MTRYFTKDHEWIDVAGDTATVGITDYAQSQLGDVVFVEVPDAGRQLVQGGDAAVVESVKAASDVLRSVGRSRRRQCRALRHAGPEGTPRRKAKGGSSS